MGVSWCISGDVVTWLLLGSGVSVYVGVAVLFLRRLLR